MALPEDDCAHPREGSPGGPASAAAAAAAPTPASAAPDDAAAPRKLAHRSGRRAAGTAPHLPPPLGRRGRGSCCSGPASPPEEAAGAEATASPAGVLAWGAATVGVSALSSLVPAAGACRRVGASTLLDEGGAARPLGKEAEAEATTSRLPAVPTPPSQCCSDAQGRAKGGRKGTGSATSPAATATAEAATSLASTLENGDWAGGAVGPERRGRFPPVAAAPAVAPEEAGAAAAAAAAAGVDSRPPLQVAAAPLARTAPASALSVQPDPSKSPRPLFRPPTPAPGSATTAVLEGVSPRAARAARADSPPPTPPPFPPSRRSPMRPSGTDRLLLSAAWLCPWATRGAGSGTSIATPSTHRRRGRRRRSGVAAGVGGAGRARTSSASRLSASKAVAAAAPAAEAAEAAASAVA